VTTSSSAPAKIAGSRPTHSTPVRWTRIMGELPSRGQPGSYAHSIVSSLEARVAG
jgi:hypothetical protein